METHRSFDSSSSQATAPTLKADDDDAFDRRSFSPFSPESHGSPSGLSPNSRDRSYTAIVNALLERHPSISDKLVERVVDRQGPTKHGWRKATRWSFYVIVALALVERLK